MTVADLEPPTLISTTTVFSLLSTLAILLSAYLLSTTLLPRASTLTTRILFIWHAFDSLIHLILESSYLYNCFFSWTSIYSLDSPTTRLHPPSAYLPPDIHFLNNPTRLYGPNYGSNPFAALWREYARADARWGGSDLTVISLEILTVFLAGPIAAMVCVGLVKGWKATWFWMVVLATGELYGGFMTFAPEWLSGNRNLDGSNWMFLWLYLVFFNAGLWVVIPFWVLYVAYKKIVGALGSEDVGKATKKRK